MRYLLDTSVYSQALRRKTTPGVVDRWQRVGDSRCSISIVTAAEVEWGLHKLASPSARARYESLLKPRLTVHPTDAAVWNQFARIKAIQETQGRPVADLDLLIAATAEVHGLVVATCNPKHFSLIAGPALEDWSAG